MTFLEKKASMAKYGEIYLLHHSVNIFFLLSIYSFFSFVFQILQMYLHKSASKQSQACMYSENF